MGGFRFNGCGVTDHYKHIKSLGMHVCPNCKKLSEFTLDEANQKIDVFWIPTLTLKSRYAVMCKKCKNGEFCSVEWAGHLMNQTADQEVIFESMANTVKEPEQADVPVNNNKSQAKPLIQPKVSDSSDIPHFFTCSACGVTQMLEGNACTYCGEPVPAIEPAVLAPVLVESASKSTEPTPEHVTLGSGSTGQTVSFSADVICPSCGNVQEAGNKFCIRCGQKLIMEQPKDKFCFHCGAKIVEGMLFCMECGSKI